MGLETYNKSCWLEEKFHMDQAQPAEGAYWYPYGRETSVKIMERMQRLLDTLFQKSGVRKTYRTVSSHDKLMYTPKFADFDRNRESHMDYYEMLTYHSRRTKTRSSRHTKSRRKDTTPT